MSSANSDCGSSTDSPRPAAGQISARAAADPAPVGATSTGMSRAWMAAAVAGPTAATLVSAGIPGSNRRVRARSVTASTAFTEVNPTQS